VTTRPQRRRSPQDLLSGAAFVVLGLGFAVGATAYRLGTPTEMGPGAFPFVLGLLLAGIGLTTVARGLLTSEEEPIGAVSWRAILLIGGGIVFFGLTARGLGVAPAIFGAVLLAAFASSRTRPRAALAIAGGITALCVLIFVLALQLRLPLIGPWLGGL
jgi:hypothetical protein